MDGPNVNLKLLESLHNSRDEGHRKLLEIGTYDLHVLHGAFQTGHSASGWAVNGFLRSAYGLFKDSPASSASYAGLLMLKLLKEHWKCCQISKSVFRRSQVHCQRTSLANTSKKLVMIH